MSCEDPSTILLDHAFKKKAHLFHDGFPFSDTTAERQTAKKVPAQQVRQVLALPSSQGTKAEGSGYWDPKRTKLACFVHGETRNWRVNGENCLKIQHISEVDAFGGSATISRINQNREAEREMSITLQLCPDLFMNAEKMEASLWANYPLKQIITVPQEKIYWVHEANGKAD